MSLAKFVLPALLVVTGVGAAVYATVSNDSGSTVAAGSPDAWIDAPVGDMIYAPGTIDVFAHATAHDEIRALELVVDDHVVATDRDLERTEKLYAGTFTWKAAVGTHRLQVRPVGGKVRASSIVVIEVAKGGVVATTTPATTIRRTTTTSSSTTTTTKPGTVTTVPPVTTTRPGGGGTPAPNTTPPTSPATTAPPAAVVIVSTSKESPAGDNRLYVGSCAYTMGVTAVVQNASSVRVWVNNQNWAMTRSGNTYTATLHSGPPFTAADVGVHQVLVKASGGGVDRSAVAGQVDVRLNCPKD